MIKKVFSYIIFIFVLCPVILFVAQEKTGRIMGKVVSATGGPEFGVTVNLFAPSGPQLQTITDIKGSFEFLSLSPSDEYVLKCELKGFKRRTKTNIIVAAGKTTELNLVMVRRDLAERGLIIIDPEGVLPKGMHEHMQLTEEQIEAFRSAKTVRLIVEQSYQDNRRKDLKNVSIPVEYVVEKVLKFIGLQVIGPEVKDYDLEIKVITQGTSWGWYRIVYHSSAQLANDISFKIANVPLYAVTIYTYAEGYRPHEAISELIKARRNPFAVDELAHQLVRSFEGNVVELMVEIFGISVLTERLSDKSASVRKYAAESLRYVKGQRSVEPLIVCLEDENADVRVAAIKSLSGIDDSRRVAPLIEAVKQEDVNVRMAAVESLGYLEDERAVKPLITILKDDDIDVRIAAIKSLGHLKGEQVVEPLIACLQDKDEVVREVAVRSLGHIKDSRAVEALKGALKDKNKDVRAAALDALLDDLVLWLDDLEEDEILKAALKDKDACVRAIVLKEIWLLDDDQVALEYLLSASTDKSEIVRAAAVGSLDEYHDGPHVIESLIAALGDKEDIVRAAAAESLGYINEPKVIEPLLNCLKDREETVRAVVLEALKHSDDPRVVEALIATLNSKDENFRMYVDEVLETITSNSFDGNQKKWKKWWSENKEEFIKKRQI